MTSFSKLLALFTLTTAIAPAVTRFPEPEVVFFGTVCANDGRENCILHSGTLSWTIQPPTGDAIVVTAELGDLAGGLSYILKIPAENLVEGTTISPNTLEATATARNHDRSQVTVGGVSYNIAFPLTANKDTLVYGEQLRGKIERIDLALVIGQDTDTDMIPDSFEDLYAADGLDKNNPNDADDDIDGDGKTNLEEYLAGTDPNGFDYATWAALPSTGLAPDERDRGMDKEGDGSTNLYEFAIGAKPNENDAEFQKQVLKSDFVEVGGKDYLALTFTKPTVRRVGVIYHIETSDTVGDFKRASQGAVIIIEDSRGTLKARTAVTDAIRQFMRLSADVSQ